MHQYHLSPSVGSFQKDLARGSYKGIQGKKGNEENNTISTWLVYCFINPSKLKSSFS